MFFDTIITVIIISIIVIAFLLTVVALMRACFLKASRGDRTDTSEAKNEKKKKDIHLIYLH